MPAIIRVKVIDARDLPVMDRASDLTDAFVELRLGTALFKTDVCRKSLNPQWDSDWFKFEVDDEELQEEVLQVKVRASYKSRWFSLIFLILNSYVN